MDMRKFRPGDWVRLKGKNETPFMQVTRCAASPKKENEDHGSGKIVECVYYKNGQRTVAYYHQNRLIRSLRGNSKFKA